MKMVSALIGVLGVLAAEGDSRARHNFGEKCELALNAQINLEYEVTRSRSPNPATRRRLRPLPRAGVARVRGDGGVL